MATEVSRTLEVGTPAKSNHLQIFDGTPSANFTQYQMSSTPQLTRNPLKLPKTVVRGNGSLEVAYSHFLCILPQYSHMFWHPVMAY